MGKNKNRPFYVTADLNALTFDYYLRRFYNLATTTISWKNMPPSVDTRYLERLLYERGMAVFFYDDDMGEYLALDCAIGGEENVYHIPYRRMAYSVDYEKMLNSTNSVIIFNNFVRSPTKIDMQLFAARLYELDRSIDVNIKQQKTPKIITCSENERLTFQNLMMQYEGNVPFIYANKALNLEGIAAVDIAAPFVTDKMQIAKRQIFNEALSFLGIENNSNEKAERLVTSESQSNLGIVQAERDSRLAARKQACEQINAMFNLNIDVEFKNPLSTELEMETEGGAENGTLHD